MGAYVRQPIGTIVTFACVFVANACAEPTAPREVGGIDLSVSAGSTRSLYVGDTQQLVARVWELGTGNDIRTARVVWASSDTTIATVTTSGLVTARGGGTATITASSGGVTALATTKVVVWSRVQAGSGVSIGLSTAGEAYWWGVLGGIERLAPGRGGIDHLQSPVSVVAGRSYACLLVPAGQVYCWGENGFSQLGFEGARLTSYPETPVAGPVRFASIAAGAQHVCGLTSGGAAYCWGRGYEGQLGDGTNTGSRAAPARVAGTFTFVQVSAFGSHTCALRFDGAAYCWGENDDGQLGDSTRTGRNAPVPVSGGHRFTQIAAGGYFSCGLTASGEVFCWGSNAVGTLGIGVQGASQAFPVAVAGASGFVFITAGSGHVCGLTGAGAVYCWGGGQAVRDNGGADVTTPMLVGGGHVFRQVSAGASYTCGVTERGLAHCWGGGYGGVFGNGQWWPTSAVPVPVSRP